MSEKLSFSVYTNPKVIAIAFLGFASGMPLALTLSTLSAWLTKAGIDKTTIGIFALIGTPYSLKFLWSHMVNHLPLPPLTTLFGARRGWIIFTQIGLIISIAGLGMADPANDLLIMGYFALSVAIFSATQDIAIDAYRIESLEEKQQGAGAAMNTFGYRIAMLVSGAGSLFMADKFGWSFTYNFMAGLMFIGIVTALLIKEPGGWHEEKDEDKLSRQKRLKYLFIAVLIAACDYAVYLSADFFTNAFVFDFGSQLIVNFGSIIRWGYFLITSFMLAGALIAFLTGSSMRHTSLMPFKDFTKKPGWLMILLFIVLYKFGDAFAGVMTNPFLIDIGFSLTEIAKIVKLYGFVATLIGLFAGGILVHHIGMIKSLWLGGILQMLSNLMFVWQANIGHDSSLLIATIAAENFSGGLGTAVFIAYLSVLCNVKYTATQYALLSSLAATGRTWLSASSGYFVDSYGWVNFFLISTAIALPGLLILLLLQEKKNYLK